MVIAVFILVVMSLLAATILRVSQTEEQASSHELSAVRAFYAAESAAQWAMNQLFISLEVPPAVPPNFGDCSAVEGTPFVIPGYAPGASGPYKETAMRQCRVVEHVICRSRTIGLPDPAGWSSYTIIATAECGAEEGDAFTARRTVTMEATRLDN